jgi:hypothetical protein
VGSAEVHDRLIASEYFWYGGIPGSAKVFDAGTSFAAEPSVWTGPSAVVEQAAEQAAEVAYFFELERTEHGWEILEPAPET